MQKSNHKSSSLRQKAAQIGMSLGSDRTSLGDSGSRINTSFDLDISIIESNNQRNLSMISTVTPIRAKIADKKSKNRLDHSRRNYLTKVLVNRALNVRLGIKKMQEIPTALFKRGENFQIASRLIMKSKATLQTSILRTLLYDLEEKVVQVTKLKMECGNNIFVIPTVAQNTSHKSNAILKLNSLLTDSLKAIINKFALHRNDCLTLKRYLAKYVKNFVQMRKDAVTRFKMLPQARGCGNYQQIELNKMISIIEKVEERILRLKLQAFNSLVLRSEVMQVNRQNIAKLIIMCSKLRRQDCFKLWRRGAFIAKPKQDQVQIAEVKLEALQRIVQRNYFKLFKEINRRIFMIKKAAVRLGCYSRISQQKSLWRWLVHAKTTK